MAILFGLISSLIACFQSYLAMLNVHGEYLTSRKKLFAFWLGFSCSFCLLDHFDSSKHTKLQSDSRI